MTAAINYNAAMYKRRGLTQREEEWGDNLARIWAAKKRELGLTQDKAAEALGVTQGAINGYLNKRTAINAEVAKAFAGLLNVSLYDIRPDLQEAAVVVEDTKGEYGTAPPPAQIPVIHPSLIDEEDPRNPSPASKTVENVTGSPAGSFVISSPCDAPTLRISAGDMVLITPINDKISAAFVLGRSAPGEPLDYFRYNNLAAKLPDLDIGAKPVMKSMSQKAIPEKISVGNPGVVYGAVSPYFAPTD